MNKNILLFFYDVMYYVSIEKFKSFLISEKKIVN